MKRFPFFRAPGSNIPFPTRQEYLDGDVPTLSADVEVEQRLQTNGWACVLDLASVGKTTLALRLATTREQREHPVFYLDLKTETLDDVESGPGSALRRLARPGALLILDNIHHQPELARQLWHQWKADPRDSRLLIVATKIQPQVITTPEQDLIFFERHPTNPAILLALEPDDLGRIAAHIYRRVTGASMPQPSMAALTDWNRDYRAALNAFSFAVMHGLPDLQRGNWLLPPSYASEWVRQVWLKQLDEREVQNAFCLAAFGAQELELLVPDTALPYPGQIEQLLKLGLVVRSEVGRFGQYRHFGLREPGWGRLILAAAERPVDVESILFSAAVRHPMIAVIMSHRLKTEGFAGTNERLWESLVANREALAFNLFLADVPLTYVANLLRDSASSNYSELTSFLWQAIESQPDKLVARAWETSLEKVGSFLEVAKRHGRDTEPLWQAIESQHDKLADRAWETSLEKVGSFLEVAKRHGRDSEPLWRAIESQPDKLADRAWQTPLDHIGSFFEVAKQQDRSLEALSQMLANEPRRLSQKGMKDTLNSLVGFSHHAPNLLEIALRDIKAGHWNATPVTQGTGGATWLASACGRIGRTDLSSDLIALLLRRANWRDFHVQAGGFEQACWLLANIPPAATELLEPFLKAVCTNKWLQIAYSVTKCGQLATGLRRLALHQSVEQCRRFHHRGLGSRLYNELARFETADSHLQSEIIQFLGSAGLCGWAISLKSLANIKPETISNLPTTVQPHRDEATRVENWQLQLWLGLRVFVSITKSVLPIPQDVLEKTLVLWRKNLSETTLEPESTLHKLSQGMVAWLETCLNTNPVGLLPSRDPLWTLVGFPVRLDLPER